ncbi:MAG TPA: autotransporter outer membrane beta-barrel domain-containing protein, partial [Saprospiraceae bacterium]|nr:autotransporter outer membrane beta-barrel domain-containing protein [Saprospiraceae bacterium]
MSTVLNNQGIINLFSGSNIFRRTNSQFITTGIIRGVGTLTINGSTPFVNNGTIDMANNSIGTITIGGNMAGRNFTNNGTIIVDIGPGNTSDQINVGNIATLGGTLVVKDITGTGAFTSGTFTIVTAGTRSGTFASIQYPNSDTSWDPQYLTASFLLGYAGSALPIELLAFGGKQVGAVIQLHWETATERDNDYVEVQRSHDGKRFEAL